MNNELIKTILQSFLITFYIIHTLSFFIDYSFHIQLFGKFMDRFSNETIYYDHYKHYHHIQNNKKHY